MSKSGKQHWEAVKWIFRYLKCTLDRSICFIGVGLKLEGYLKLQSSQVDLAGDANNRKSTTGFVYTLGGIGVCWDLKLLKIVTISTTEAKYVAVTEAGYKISMMSLVRKMSFFFFFFFVRRTQRIIEERSIFS